MDRFGLAGRRDLFEEYGTSNVQGFYRAITMLHELGHAIVRIRPGSTIIRDDGPDFDPRGRRGRMSSDIMKLVFDNCLKGVK